MIECRQHLSHGRIEKSLSFSDRKKSCRYVFGWLSVFLYIDDDIDDNLTGSLSLSWNGKSKSITLRNVLSPTYIEHSVLVCTNVNIL